MSNRKAIFSLFLNIGSNVFSQILIVIFIPILARIYKPEDFALATLFLGVASCFVSISSLRLSVTIPIAENKEEKGRALVLSASIVILLSLLFFIFSKTWPIFDDIGLGKYKNVIFAYMMVLSFNSILTGVIISSGNYNFIGGSKVLTSVVLNFSRLFISYAGLSSGLIYSLIISEVIAFFVLLYGSRTAIKNYTLNHKFVKKDYVLFIRKYKDYPKYQVLSQFVLISSQYAPVFMMSKSYSAMQIGFFVMANNLVSMPVNSIGLALSQIYLGEYRKQEKRRKIFKHSIFIVLLFMISSLPFVFILYIWGESIVEFILGEQWKKAAPLISMLIFLGAAKLCMAVISQSLNIFKAQKLQLGINILFFFSSYLSLYAGIYYKFDFDSTVLSYTVFGSVALLIGVILTLRNIKINSTDNEVIYKKY
ncbi:lipopolysaccharide biosynthesis protein [Vibrio crassostreae]|uniref:O-antigen/teichoic acid export membrane protein n=1 Tax=Vibrio crassostreae TaxID=246167 RepID=A0ABP1WTW9_9VIBR|nr:oligosaccharide flippase family protein [Vibrio crassostreae]TCL27633.1 O-antigen/teichoic acid export membrane protein [Vibrio crassostreae]TCT49008.1 O-antigen/teichoic acid export membrane protein [Vibrio crassostreae]TCT58568.1 O-antigen/teichoic acid export membrane protein [Vibrio crassostreae]CAK1709921.1 O-antigen/teichoic acid export membrane protein [Vibrio crassostreae]CAK1711708.1 O-antigen/teichoic acid export membrane protein [Vibrio crassostreae]